MRTKHGVKLTKYGRLFGGCANNNQSQFSYLSYICDDSKPLSDDTSRQNVKDQLSESDLSHFSLSLCTVRLEFVLDENMWLAKIIESINTHLIDARTKL